MGKWIKKQWLKDEVGPGVHYTDTTGGAIAAKALVALDSSNEPVQASADATNVAGIALSTTALGTGVSADFAVEGAVTGVAALAITKGEVLKAYANGTVGPLLNSALADATIDTATGDDFANQPANDGVEVLSSSASDTGSLVIYGTTNGTDTVVAETVTLNGTTFVATTKTDWGIILGVEVPAGSPLTVGNITVREASGNATICTLTAGAQAEGIEYIPASAQRAFNQVVRAVADAGTTKQLGVVGVTSAGATAYASEALTGATAVDVGTQKFIKVTKILKGDLESARTVTLKTEDTAESETRRVGFALESVAAGADVDFLLQLSDVTAPSVAAGDVAITDAGGFFSGSDVEAALQELADAATITITDVGSKFVSTTVEDALQELALAATIDIADAGGYFVGTTVESALQELGALPSGNLKFTGQGSNSVTTTAETVFTGLSHTITGGTLTAGDIIRWEWSTWFSASGSSKDDCRTRVRLGGVGGQVIHDGGNTGGAHLVPLLTEGRGWCRFNSIGATADVTATGNANVQENFSDGTAAQNSNNSWVFHDSTVTVDTTGDLDVVLTHEFSASSGSNAAEATLLVWVETVA